MRRAGNGGTAAGNGTEAASSTPPNRAAAPRPGSRAGASARQPGRRLDRVRGALLNARAGDGTGRVAQRESTPFTRVGSQVQSLSRPPLPSDGKLAIGRAVAGGTARRTDER